MKPAMPRLAKPFLACALALANTPANAQAAATALRRGPLHLRHHKRESVPTFRPESILTVTALRRYGIVVKFIVVL